MSNFEKDQNSIFSTTNIKNSPDILSMEENLNQYTKKIPCLIRQLEDCEPKNIQNKQSKYCQNLADNQKLLESLENEINRSNNDIESIKKTINLLLDQKKNIPKINIFESPVKEFELLDKEYKQQEKIINVNIIQKNNELDEIKNKSFYGRDSKKEHNERENDFVVLKQQREKNAKIVLDFKDKIINYSSEISKLKTIAVFPDNSWLKPLNFIINYLNRDLSDRSFFKKYLRRIFIKPEFIERIKFIEIQITNEVLNYSRNLIEEEKMLLKRLLQAEKNYQDFQTKLNDPIYKQQSSEFYYNLIKSFRKLVKERKSEENNLRRNEDIFIDKAAKLESDLVISKEVTLEMEIDCLLRQLNEKTIIKEEILKPRHAEIQENIQELKVLKKPDIISIVSEASLKLDTIIPTINSLEKCFANNPNSVLNFLKINKNGENIVERNIEGLRVTTPFNRHKIISRLEPAIKPLEDFLGKISNVLIKNYQYVIELENKLSNKSFNQKVLQNQINQIKDLIKSLQATFELVNNHINKIVKTETKKDTYNCIACGHLAEGLYSALISGNKRNRELGIRWEITNFKKDIKEKIDMVASVGKVSLRLQLSCAKNINDINKKKKTANKYNVAFLSIPSFDELSKEIETGKHNNQAFFQLYFVKMLKSIHGDEQVSIEVKNQVRTFLKECGIE